jgi:hypothetical protein
VTRCLVVDFDSVEDIERVWHQIQRYHAARDADPQLYDAVAKRIDEALTDGSIAEAEAEKFRAELDQAHPAAVLAAHWRSLIRDRPALGAYLTGAR